jgi:hypothetical protein
MGKPVLLEQALGFLRNMVHEANKVRNVLASVEGAGGEVCAAQLRVVQGRLARACPSLLNLSPLSLHFMPRTPLSVAHNCGSNCCTAASYAPACSRRGACDEGASHSIHAAMPRPAFHETAWRLRSPRWHGALITNTLFLCDAACIRSVPPLNAYVLLDVVDSWQPAWICRCWASFR